MSTNDPQQHGDVKRPDGLASALVWGPDLVALAAGISGAVGLAGTSRWLCVAAIGATIARLGLRASRRGAPAASAGASLVATLPALVLLIGVIVVAPGLRARTRPLDAANAAEPAIRLNDAPPEARDCLASPSAQAYVDALHRHLEETWEAADASGEGGFVVLGFLLDAEGGVRLSRVIDQSSETYRAFGTEALSRAAPFGPLRGELACLAQIELRATLDRTDLR